MQEILLKSKNKVYKVKKKDSKSCDCAQDNIIGMENIE